MRSDSDKRNLVIVNEMSGITRWAPLAVVLSVVGGFVSLSWYAYHAGMQSVKEEDLVIVEADKSPMKEKPADPGGMHFPNQDKTVFDTFASSGKQPPKVERALPPPEEPLSKEVDSSDASTFVNSKLDRRSGTEQVIAQNTKKQELQKVKTPSYTDNPDRQVITAQDNHDEEESVTYVAPRQQSPVPSQQVLDDAVKASATDKRGQPFAPEKLAVSDAQKQEAARSRPKIEFADSANDEPSKNEAITYKTPKEDLNPRQEAKQKVVEPTAEPTHERMPSAGGGSSVIQLGAYRSEKEAIDAWEKMHLKQKELSDKKPLVVRADLGAKGIYFRLRVVGLDSAAEAKALCSALSAKGQACLVATDK